MSVNRKRRETVCLTGVVTTLVTLFCLIVVSSRRFGDFRNPTSRDTVTSSVDVNSSDVCTPDAFRSYFRTLDYFPGEGHWDSRSAPDNVSTLYRFVPDLCKFYFDGFRSLPAVNIRRCLRLRGVTRIATVGDSNAARYYSAVLAALVDGDGDWRCVSVAAEAIDSTMLIPDVRYFARHDGRLLPLLSASVRHCSSCVSRLHRCGHRAAPTLTNASETLWLEHLSMVSVLDSSVKIDVPHNHFAVNLRYRADTFQEFLLKYYLHSRYPDLLIIFLPFNHDKNAETSSSLAGRLQYFLSLMDLYLPDDVQVLWVPSFGEFESRKPPAWANRRSHGLLATDKLDAFNRLLYTQLRRRLLDPSSRNYAFLDLVRVSADRESWSLDGIHMDPRWYRLVMSYLLQAYCGPDIL